MSLPSTVRHWLVAPATVLVLLVSLALACLAGLLVPQTIYRGEEYYRQLEASSPLLARLIAAMGLDRIYTTWWFLLLVAIFALSLCCTVWDQTGSRRSRNVPRLRPPGAGYQQTRLLSGAFDPWPGLQADLFRRGFRLAAAEKKGLRHLALFQKGQMGLWGMPVFHLGILLVLLGALYGLAFHNRQFVQIMEGETLAGTASDWLTGRQGVLARPLELDLSFRLDRFTVSHWPSNELRGVSSSLTLTDRQGREETVTISVSSPLNRNGVTWYQSTDFGQAVTFVMEQPGAAPVYSHFLLDRNRRPDQPLTGGSDFPTTPYVFDLALHPEANAPPFLLGEKPEVALTLKREGQVILQERIPLGMGFVLFDREFYFIDVRPWSGLFLVTGYAMPLLYLGFSVALAGLLLHYALVPRTLFLCLDGHELSLAWDGASRRLPGSDLELAAIAGETTGPDQQET